MKPNLKSALCMLAIIVFFNLYFLLFIDLSLIQYLYYGDFLLLIFLSLYFYLDYRKIAKFQKRKADYLKASFLIYGEDFEFENKDILKHDLELIQNQLSEQIEINQDQIDFITKWCHEIKLPLTTLGLLNEHITQPSLKAQTKEQIETMNLYLNAVMVACKVQAPFDDLHLKKINLKKCIHTSIKNHRYFLIKNNIEINIQVEDIDVYSDEQWLVYIIDQLLFNAIKYAKENPIITFSATTQDNIVKFYLKDNGEGILDSDLPRIFDRGYVGSNHHNGKYKSTGMGLYMVHLMIQKLGHKIDVESIYGRETCFCITFKNNESFFHL